MKTGYATEEGEKIRNNQQQALRSQAENQGYLLHFRVRRRMCHRRTIFGKPSVQRDNMETTSHGMRENQE